MIIFPVTRFFAGEKLPFTFLVPVFIKKNPASESFTLVYDALHTDVSILIKVCPAAGGLPVEHLSFHFLVPIEVKVGPGSGGTIIFVIPNRLLLPGRKKGLI